ncbi:helix-turn-helix domain-containing protein [Streptomyces sp. CBMA156]|uniref:helix-turn-helix domain-containing protein n=1 Tax=Streptomyces sp. CBMA156 TaxID=1930280 RepID=UPI001661AEFD|nr:Scr1 family TA system antitoxin-like transcriptional regulator [Streptomyces sp. CBMA156]MBD0670071.1 transcriptional regulator [Streptomyces sp. CBMA156]
MAARPRPTARRIELGHELRDLRQKADVTLEDAVKGLPFSETKLQRVETGLQDLRNAGDLRRLLARYAVTCEEEVNRLVELQRTASRQDWWTPYTAAPMTTAMPRFLGVESASQAIRAFHPTVVLGLLQTQGYAKALHELAKPVEETTTEFVQKSVALRMERKERLLALDDPVKLWAILYEPALRYVVGSEDIMCEQYEEIIRLSKVDTVTVQVLPQSNRGYLALADFTLLDLGEKLPATVQVDTAGAGMSITDKPRDVGQFVRSFEALSRSALPAEETPAFLKKLTREITTP